MNSRRNHSHVQIQYYRRPKNQEELQHYGDGRILVETLIGVDPRQAKDRELLHGMLDEYLDMWVIPKLNQADGINPEMELTDYEDTVNFEEQQHEKNHGGDDHVHFKVFGCIDCH